MPAENPIQPSLQAVNQRLEKAAIQAGRDPTSLCLIAVSKTFPVSAIQFAYEAGCKNFGENYAQEFKNKAEQLAYLDLVWHFIGPLQSNKTAVIAQWAQWVHSIDRLKIAKRLSDQRPPSLPPLNVCIQVNVSQEISKSGCEPDEVLGLAHEVALLPSLRLRGLMCIPNPSASPQENMHQLNQLRVLQKELNRNHLNLDVLSMGMSDDLEIAVAQGATHLRVGRAIFGARASRPSQSRRVQCPIGKY